MLNGAHLPSLRLVRLFSDRIDESGLTEAYVSGKARGRVPQTIRPACNRNLTCVFKAALCTREIPAMPTLALRRVALWSMGVRYNRDCLCRARNPRFAIHPFHDRRIFRQSR